MPLGNRIALANLWLLEGVVKSQLAKSPASAALLHTTIAPTMLQGSVKENVLPMKAMAVVNFRIIPGETSAGVLEYCKKTIDDARVKIRPLELINDPSPVSDPDAPSFAVLKRTVRQIFPEAVVAPFLNVAGSDTIHYAPISENIYRFAPVHVKADDLKRLHGIDERIAVANYEKMVRFYIQLIKNSAQ
jgi:carboxypeptidase PM20D1